ncbi:MAG: hypothetical protein AVDCRST_MAG73-1929 [uncultured Thermomicrobiales bacterium]|uniref:Uncharacterized protein n=1 Tax=uncultured Thermomicrobiales bacterium TaxID=1645740 RepID=A0A6J4U7R6_9BACT|nr:MAG: hypothetical protein AVDCRST_MAG73-1929 [uncultured Thermomicrobiales bacterium]
MGLRAEGRGPASPALKSAQRAPGGRRGSPSEAEDERRFPRRPGARYPLGPSPSRRCRGASQHSGPLIDSAQRDRTASSR